jgi:hypothetical protein
MVGLEIDCRERGDIKLLFEHEILAKASDCVGGTAAVSIKYDFGTDRDTLVNYSRYLGKLSYKY